MVESLFPINLNEAVVSKQGKALIGPITHSLPSGGPTMILGPNGAGKTTVLRLIHGLDRTRTGTLSFGIIDQQEIYKRQSFVFQKPIMLRRSALDNMLYPLILHGMDHKEAIVKAEAMLERVGLARSVKTRATYLSGGEAQKLALGRALITEPELLILDEPTASLDSSSIRDLERLIQDTAQSGVEILMTTHDMGQARRLGARIIFLHQGQLIEMTDANEFWEAPQSEEASRFVKGEIV